MPSLTTFPSSAVKKVTYGDESKWEQSVDQHGNVTMTLKPGQTDTVTVEYREGVSNQASEQIACGAGSTVLTTSAAIVVRAK